MLGIRRSVPPNPVREKSARAPDSAVEWKIETRSVAGLLDAELDWPDQPLLIAAPRSLAQSMTRGSLSTDELQRLNGFLVHADRERFRLAHDLKRRVIARLLGCTPRSLQFQYTERGKPYMPGSALAFNLSHSGDWILLGFRAGHTLGVDVEEYKPELLKPMAQWFFHTNEYREWFASEYPDQQLVWHWVMKEALAKASGAGVAMPFYCVRLYPHRNHYESWYRQHRWLLDRRALDERHYLALATDGPIRRVRLIVLNGDDQSTASKSSS